MEADTEVYGRVGTVASPSRGAGEDYEHARAMYTAQMAEFLGAVAEGGPPRPTSDDGVVVMRVVGTARPPAEGGPARVSTCLHSVP